MAEEDLGYLKDSSSRVTTLNLQHHCKLVCSEQFAEKELGSVRTCCSLRSGERKDVQGEERSRTSLPAIREGTVKE